MIDGDELEFEALALYAAAGADPSDPPGVDALCRRLLGSAPRREAMIGLADLTPLPTGYRLRVNRLAPPEQVAFLIGHELAEWWLDERGISPATLVEREALCDALGARLACPGPAFAHAIDVLGHRVADLARRFRVPRALALLRIGEVARRPVRLLGTPIRTRGAPFDWHRGRVHPVRLADEGKWGLMAG